ncbi:hypothetical protein [Sphingobacterium sp. JUb56]|uniref:hypothetical protein n=1 Tax=Sphingobacterium sp. JUb56 TaxID=2587145 RepID=UPI00161F1DBC|nr:hypothetical protein [Sphingobacterium sp. JUb56]MBB2951953.1 tellurite resistance protein TehA-like permease [Sphingobacterium sp. JUb56]
MFIKINYFWGKLTNMPDHIKQILEHATSQGYRSNVLKPLYGLMVILLLGMCLGLYLKNETIAYICLGFALLIAMCFLVCYFYCLFKNPDLLRSERFNLEKTALEKISVTGDSTVGKLKMQETDYVVIQSENVNVKLEQDLSNENIPSND